MKKLRRKYIIYLGTYTETIVNGEPVMGVNTWSIKYARKLSIRQKEFYEARTIGMKPELMFEIRTIEYDEQKRLKFEDVEYEIYRTYEKGENVELICSKVANG